MKSKEAPNYFTRHLLRAGLQCPVKLYYKAHNFPEDQSIQPFLEHAGFNKHFLKKVAGQQRQDAVLVRGESREERTQKTAGLLQQEEVIILEASFIYQQYYTKVPILIKSDADIKLIDIQTKAFNPYKHQLLNNQGKILQKWKPYIVDLAYKRLILQKITPQWHFQTKLMLPDKTKISNSDHLLQRLQKKDADFSGENLFCTLDVTSHVDTLCATPPFVNLFGNKSFNIVLKELKERYLNPKWESPPIGKRCSRCEFCISESQKKQGVPSGFDYCWKESDKIPEFSETEPTVLDLIGPGVQDWLDRGIYLQKNVPLKKLPPLKSILKTGSSITHKQRQSLQVRQAKGKEIPSEIIKKPIFEEINRWEYPVHFLDFEAGNYSIPIRKDRKPYDVVLFQFSCHTLYADGRCIHHQWIDETGTGYPNYDMVRQLMEVPHIMEGTIVQYSNFEKYALKKVRKELKKEADMVPDATELINWIGNMVERHDSRHPYPPYLADLSRLVKNYYYNCHMNDSLSIKHVVKSVLTISDILKKKYSKPYQSHNFDGIIWWQQNEGKEGVKSPYAILRQYQQETQVGRGTEAMVVYGKLLTRSFPRPQKKKILNALLKYCELDTLAMVMIFEHWKGLAQSN